jgi:hypothetical protein
MGGLSKRAKIALYIAAGVILLILALCMGAAVSQSVAGGFLNMILAIFMKVVSVVMLIMFVASVALLIFTLRKPKIVSVLSLIIAVGVSLISLVVYSVLIRYEPPFWLWLLMLALGAGIGFFWARTTRIFTENGQVMSRNSIWYLAIWGAVFAVNQIITIVTNRPPDIAMALLLISTATVWGTNGNIFWRYYKIRSERQPQAIVAVGQPESQLTLASKSASDKEASPIAACPKCGAAVTQKASFCMKCGGKL